MAPTVALATHPESYKKVPRGFDPDHPRAELLRHTAFHVMLKEPLPKSVSSAVFASWCATRLAKLAPVHRWLVDNMM